MQKFTSVLVIILSVLFINSNYLLAMNNEDLQIKGKIYVDLYYVLTTATNIQNSQKNGEFSKLVDSTRPDESAGRAGFQIRRIYLTINKKISDILSSRVRFETGNASYSLNTDKSMIPFIKDAYLKYKYAANHSVTLGISGPPTLKIYEEKLWGYRSVEKVPEDLYKIRSSRDFGIAFAGSFKNIKYNFMFGNGHGSETEDQTYKEKKSFYLGLIYNLTKNLFAELYGDADAVWKSSDKKYTTHILVGYVTSKIRVGLQYIYQDLAKPEYINIISLPFAYNITKKFSILARFDNRRVYKPADKNFTGVVSDNFIILGTDFSMAKDVHVIPNIEIAAYSSEKNSPSGSTTDAVARLTVYYKY